MKKEVLKKVSLRVILFLVLVSVVSAVLVVILNKRTKQIENQLALEMEADMIIPLFFDDSEWTMEQSENASSEVTSSFEENTDITDEESLTEGTNENTTEYFETESTDASTEDTSEEGTMDVETTDEPDTEEDTQPSNDESVDDTTAHSNETSQTATVVPTTSGTTTVAPTTLAPTTAAPTTPAPTTLAPTTPAPTTVAPTTAAPVVEKPVPMPAAESTANITAGQLAVFKNRILQRLNELRAGLGLGSLALNDCLTSGAIIRSQEIPVAWSHTRPNGERGIYILAGCGGWYREAINALKAGQPYNCALGENLAVAYSESNFAGSDAELCAIADEMFDMWVGSPSHYANLVYPGYKYVGLGINVNMDDVFHAFWGCMLFSN